MNALLRPTIARLATRSAAVRQATTHVRPSNLPKQYQQNFKRDWLSDPSTYPIIVIMGCAMTFMVGMGSNALLNYKDVRVDPKKRNAMIRDWGEGESQPLLRKAIYWNSWQKNNPEGMGVDHEAWKKGKEEYYGDIKK